MKKILVLFFVIFVAMLCFSNNAFLDYLTQNAKCGEVRFYCLAKCGAGAVVKEIQNGASYEYISSVENAKNAFGFLNGCYGYSVHFENTEKLDEILKQVCVLKVENVGGVTNYYGSVQGAVFFNFLGAQKINVQIAVTNNALVVGSPMILGSY